MEPEGAWRAVRMKMKSADRHEADGRYPLKGRAKRAGKSAPAAGISRAGKFRERTLDGSGRTDWAGMRMEESCEAGGRMTVLRPERGRPGQRRTPCPRGRGQGVRATRRCGFLRPRASHLSVPLPSDGPPMPIIRRSGRTGLEGAKRSEAVWSDGKAGWPAGATAPAR